jgi:hypothetical protein
VEPDFARKSDRKIKFLLAERFLLYFLESSRSIKSMFARLRSSRYFEVIVVFLFLVLFFAIESMA